MKNTLVKRKILCFAIISSIIIPLYTPGVIHANTYASNNMEINHILGISFDDTLRNNTEVKTKDKFNCELESLVMEVHGDHAKFETQIEGEKVVFSPHLHLCQLGYNSENTFFGVSSESCGNFKLRKFQIERNALDITLLQPNKDMAGHTVASVAVYSMGTNQLYYFQFICDGINLPLDLEIEPNMAIQELANYGARAYDEVEQEYNAMGGVSSIEGSAEFDDEAMQLGADENFMQTSIFDNGDYVPKVSEESKKIDTLIDQCKDGPINLNQRSLIDNIPDNVYKVHTVGWSKNVGDYVQEGANAKRCNGYCVYHMPDVTSKNVLNYALRFENLANYNVSSQTIICSFIITHNVWVQYIQPDNKVYIFDDRGSNARIIAEGKPYIQSGTTNGYFTHFEISSIVNTNRAARITKGFIDLVPRLGDAVSITNDIFSSTQLRTGAKHPTKQYTKKLTAVMQGLKYKNDHITITGYGSGIKNFQFGFSYSHNN